MDNRSPQRTAVFQALGYAWQFGYTIVVPLVLFGVLGRWLDRKLGTAPWLFLAGVVFSIAISSVALILKALKIMQSIEREGRGSKTDRTDAPPPAKTS